MKKKIVVILFFFLTAEIVTAQTTVTFNYTGAVQSWVVPAGISSVTVDVQGAQGGTTSTGTGAAGLGGRVQATATVTAGNTLYIHVGGAGGNAVGFPTNVAGGFNGGGTANTGSSGYSGGSGGGASDITTTNNATLAATASGNVLVVAGGGGGGEIGGCSGLGRTGGVGGGTTGGAGTADCTTDPNGQGSANGGTQVAGGAAGSYGVGPGVPAICNSTAGSYGQGGNGGCTNNNYGGGAGGGGYYGGGGGGIGAQGGGSSYAGGAGVSAVTHTQGYKTSTGLVTITYNSTPAITLADNGTQVTAANVAQGTTAHVLHKISLAVTTASATLTGMQCITAGTYASADVTNLKVRYSTDNVLDAGDATLSTFTTPGVAGTKIFPAFSSQAIASGSTGYIFITADIASGATAGNTISVNAVATTDLTFSSGTKSGSSTAGGAQTIVTPAITLADNGTQVTAANVQQGTNAHVLHKISLAVTTAGATLTGIQCVTAGSYASADITNIKVRYSTDNILDAGDATLSTYTTPGVAGTKIFPSFTSQLISSGTTGYIFITADVAAGATVGNTISVNALATTDLTFTSGTKSGSSSAGGLQTIIVSSIPVIILSDNSTQISAANVAQGTSGVVLHQIALAVTTANATLTGMQCVTAGTYASADVTNIKVRYSSDPVLDGADATLSTFTTPGTAGTKTFPSFSSQVISIGTTGYIFITADIAAGATVANTINVNAVTTAHLTFSSGTKSGSSSAAGAQTIVSSTILMNTSSTNVCSANFYDSQGAASNYLDNENYTLTIYPSPGNCARAVFSSFATEQNYDYLKIYDGTSSAAPLIGQYSGSTTVPGTITAITGGGALTFNFTSDGGVNAAGWVAVLSCVAGCPIPSVSLADNGTQVAANTVGKGTVDHILHKFSLAASSQNIVTLIGVSCTTNGTYAAADLTNLKVRFSDNNTLNPGDATLSILTAGLGTGAHTFSSFTNRVISASDSGYVFITADIAASATAGNTISLSAITTSDLTYFNTVEIGSTSAGGLQTISTTAVNDHCTNAITLPVYSSCVNTAGTSLNGTATSPALGACSGTEDDDVWYRFVATASSQTITVTPIGAYDAAFELRSGSCNGTQVASSCTNVSGNGGVETFYASGLTVASTYYIRVWNPNVGSGTSTFNICVSAPYVEHVFELTLGSTGNDYGYDALKTSDGGFLMVGATSSYGAGNADGFIVKVDNTGTLQWSKTYGGSDPESFNSVQEVSTGGYILGGITGAGAYVSNAQMTASYQDGFLVRTNATGAETWSRVYRGAYRAQNFDKVYETTGGFLTTGGNSINDAASNAYCGGSRGIDLWAIKTSTSGAMLWAKNVGVCLSNENMDGSYLLSTGEFVETGWSDVVSPGLLLVKRDSDGGLLWGKSYNNTAAISKDVIQSSDGGYMITGYLTSGGAGSDDMFLLKTTATGSVSWMKAYGGVNSDIPNFVIQTTDGGYVFGGYSASFGANKYDYDGLIVKINSAGVEQWSKRFGEGGSDAFFSLRSTSYGGFLLSGYTTSAGAGAADMWLVVANSKGESTCETAVSTLVTTSIASPSEVAFGDVYVDGTQSTPTPSVSSPTPTSGPKCEVFTPLPIQLLSFNLRCQNNVVGISWKTSMEQNNNYFTVERSSDGQYFIPVGTVSGAGNSHSILSYSFTDESPLPGISYYRLRQTDFNGQSEVFAPLSSICDELNSGFDMNVHSNLISDGNINVFVQGAADERVLLVMVDILGREIYSIMLEEEADNYMRRIDVGQHIAPGLYFIIASSKDQYVSRKIIVK